MRNKSNSTAKERAKAKVKTKPFDVAEYLDNDEVIAGYLTEALATKNYSFIATAIGDVARAKGIGAISRKTGLARQNLYKSFDGKARTEFGTALKVLDAMNLKLEVKPKAVA